MQVTGLDHLVLTVASIEEACAFYVDLLGMRRHSFADGRTAVHFGDHKINLHEKGREFEPKALHPTPGSGDLCFVVADLEDAMRNLVAAGVDIELGPVTRDGARGEMTSIYLRDPDHNLIELAHYG